jgi:AcrR family transcriptional regulator
MVNRTVHTEHTLTTSESGTSTRLTREVVLHGAVELADEIGVEPLTIRKLADHLGTKPMTLYHHVANKEAILDGMVDLVFAEIELPPTDLAWRPAMCQRCVSARVALRRHPWAVPLMESRTSPGMATLRHHDAVLGCLLGGGLPMPVVAHAYAVVDAFVYGFAVQEASLPGRGDADQVEWAAAVAGIAAQMPADLFPHLAAFTAEHVLQPGYDFGDSFEVGLELILNGIEALAMPSR